MVGAFVVCGGVPEVVAVELPAGPDVVGVLLGPVVGVLLVVVSLQAFTLTSPNFGFNDETNIIFTLTASQLSSSRR